MTNNDSNDARRNQPLILEPVTPWKTPVDGAALIDAISEEVLRYMAMNPYAARTVALWVVFAHAHDCFSHSPNLGLQSPERRCGKTTLLSIILELVPKPLSASNITTAAIFRTIEEHCPTLLLDETETFVHHNEEMRGVLDSGFTCSTAYVIRLVGEQHQPKPFTTWCPKVMALIGKLPATLQDRSIVIPLRRKLATEKVERLNSRAKSRLHQLRAQAARWVMDREDEVENADPSMPAGLNDREEDAWRPLLAIADTAGDGWPEKARQLPFEIDGRNSIDDDSDASLLLAHVRSVFEAKRVFQLTSSELTNALNENEDWPWGEWQRGRPLSTRGLAQLLKPFGIQSQRKSHARFYERASFEDAWARYLPPDGVTGIQASLSVMKANNYSNINELDGDIRGDPSVTMTNDMTLVEGENINNINRMADDDACDRGIGGPLGVTNDGEVF